MKKALLLTFLFLLFTSMGFAQNNDGGIGSIEVLLKFQWNRVKDEDVWITGPELGAAARILFPGRGFLRFGLSGAVSVSFPKQIEFTFPERYDGTPLPGIDRPKPGDKITLSWNDSDLSGFSAFLGMAMRAPLAGFISVVTDMGVAFGWDSASSVNTFLYGNERRLYLDLSNNYFGLGAGVGLQVFLGKFILEAGCNLRFSFMQWSTVYLYTAKPSEKNDSSTRDVLMDTSGNFEFNKVFRFGAPYISVGYSFS